jgi:hypothetical protein
MRMGDGWLRIVSDGGLYYQLFTFTFKVKFLCFN